MRFVATVFVLFQVFSCTTKHGSGTKQYDTLKIETSITNQELTSQFYKVSGIIVPQYLVVEDSLMIDLNADGELDNLLLFTPKTLIDLDYLGIEGDNAKRVLVEILKQDNGSSIRRKHYNLVSNIGGVLSKFSGIEKVDKGFKIVHESGSRYYWKYECFFEVDSTIELVKIEKTCSYDETSETVTYSYGKNEIDVISVSDTLKANCNCDAIWEDLNESNE